MVVKKPTNKMQVKQHDHGGAGGAKGFNDRKRRTMPGLTVTQSTGEGPSELGRLHTVAKQERSLRFNNLFHPITPELLVKAYQSLSRKPTRV